MVNIQSLGFESSLKWIVQRKKKIHSLSTHLFADGGVSVKTNVNTTPGSPGQANLLYNYAPIIH